MCLTVRNLPDKLTGQCTGRPSPASIWPIIRGFDWSPREAVRGAVAVEEFFEEAFVGELRAVVVGAELVEQGRGDAPGHPLAGHLLHVPAAAQERLDHLDLGLRKCGEVGAEVKGLEG